MDAIHASREYLKSQIDPKVAKRRELQDLIDALDKEIAPIEDALAALSKTKSLKKSDVHSVLKKLAAENPDTDRQTLEELAKEKLQKELGFNLRNFANLAKRCEVKTAT